MRLTKKFLTVLAPIAIVGVITPTVVSCSNKDYKINYGDDINCKDKKDKKTYQKVAAVREAITNRIQVETREMEIDLTILNGYIHDKDSKENQNIYYEVVYHYAFLVDEKVGFTLTNWKYMSEDDTWSFTLDGTKYDETFFEYVSENGRIYLATGDTSIKFISHTYEHCTPQE